MRFPRNTRIFRGQLDPAPYAGVFFLLLIFILLSSNVVFPPGLRLELPPSADLPGIEGSTVTVAVDEGGQLYFKNQVIDPPGLQQQLHSVVTQADTPLTLVIQADQKVRYEVLVNLAILARTVGIKEAVLATRPSLRLQPAVLEK